MERVSEIIFSLPFFTIKKGTKMHEQKNVDAGKSVYYLKKKIGKEHEIGKIRVEQGGKKCTPNINITRINEKKRTT